MNPGIIGGIVGGGLGILGGVIGTYMSIKNAKGKAAKRFMKRMALYGWLFMILFLWGLFMLPRPYNFLLWVPYGIALPSFIIFANRKLAELQQDG